MAERLGYLAGRFVGNYVNSTTSLQPRMLEQKPIESIAHIPEGTQLVNFGRLS